MPEIEKQKLLFLSITAVLQVLPPVLLLAPLTVFNALACSICCGSLVTLLRGAVCSWCRLWVVWRLDTPSSSHLWHCGVCLRVSIVGEGSVTGSPAAPDTKLSVLPSAILFPSLGHASQFKEEEKRNWSFSLMATE